MSPDHKHTPQPQETRINFWRRWIEQKVIDWTEKKATSLIVGQNIYGIPILREPKSWLQFTDIRQFITTDLQMIRDIPQFIIVWFEKINYIKNDGEIVGPKWGIKLEDKKQETTLSFNGENLSIWKQLTQNEDKPINLISPITEEALRFFDQCLTPKRK